MQKAYIAIRSHKDEFHYWNDKIFLNKEDALKYKETEQAGGLYDIDIETRELIVKETNDGCVDCDSKE